MIKNYFKATLRNLWKNKAYSSINILGLAIGMASFLVILLYLNHELSYDRWNPELERVYKVSERGEDDIFETTRAPLAALLRDNASQVTSATSIMAGGSFEVPLSVADKQFYQDNTLSADSLFFRVFPYAFIQGDAFTALNRPNAMVISDRVATKLFGDENPMGKTVRVFNGFDCEVTGVLKTPDRPSHMDVDLVYRAPYEKSNFHWANQSFQTYIKTKETLPVADIERVVDELYYNHRVKESEGLTYQAFRDEGHQAGLFVDAVPDLHNFPKHGDSNITTVSILLVLAALLLLAGAINFSNLSIAASIRRAKEVGVKKVLGSSRARLFWQFMGETAFQCFIALGLSMLLLSVMLPYFNREFGVKLDFLQTGSTISLLWQFLLSLLVITLLSGMYPAIFLSRYNTSKVLKGDYSRGTKGMALRNALIVVQFVVAAFFIFGTVVVSQQLHYMQNQDTGFSGEQVLRIQPYMQKSRDDGFGAIRNTLLQIPGVQSVAKTTTVPGDVFVDTSTVAFKHRGEAYRLTSVKVSADYFNTLGIDLLEGRLFNNGQADQHTRTAIVNETAARRLGLQQTGDAYITFPYCDSIPVQVIGVVRDFNVLGFEQHVQPAVYTIGNEACMFQSGGAILVKLSGGDLRKPVTAIEEAWKIIEPGFAIRHTFLDDNFQQLFANHLRLQRIVNFFGIAAIAIALMGLFALTAFLVNQRTKEISIRKVLGAGIADLGLLLGKDFMRLIAIAVLIAVPLGWWAASEWLKGFAYRIPLTGWQFVTAALGVLVVAALTVGIHTFKATRANIADSLRDE
ncbi:ABC transporter permease [Parapedobacter pyrenivorans]|uniref:ABC transporter permease n=1 Tax=Parapedobacter pyrenivorans TaxID=1305674 RepID=A0A917HJX1_9SPHI|nr:ABC transporter permease [Parapedobacter pyrenivorans]GGG81058.1 ABC transporter permease [Parapedobacter pyrenivorans]